jgi:hypothetical protein
MKTQTLKYMHTLDGRPAYYNPGEQIYFAMRGKCQAVRLVDTLKEIHRQQKLSTAWRKQKQQDPSKWEMGWMGVLVDA